MKKHLLIFGVFVIALLVSGESCLLEEKVIEIVIQEESSAVFATYETIDNFTTPATINYGDEIDQILSDNGYTRDDIESAVVQSAAKGVVSVEGSTAWVIDGDVDLTYNGQTAKLITYTSADILALVGAKDPQPLNVAGVNLLNQALQDFLDGGNPVLTLNANGNIEPDPTVGNPLDMDWKVWITVSITMTETLEVPEPPI